MKKQILWIEDDYYAIKGLVRPLELEGFEVEVATSALDGYHKCMKWQSYDLIIVDLIMPLSDNTGPLPEKVLSWDAGRYVGLGLIKWIVEELHAQCPVLLLSVVRDPISTFGLERLGLAGVLLKRGMLPSEVKQKVHEVLGLPE